MSDIHVVDTSVYTAILLGEPDADRWSVAIRSRARRVMAAATYVECAMISMRRSDGRGALDSWLLRENIDVIPIDHTLARRAADAFARYGKGRHPAGLNFGDCFSYALAQALGAPLLFKGDDFARTDLIRA